MSFIQRSENEQKYEHHQAACRSTKRKATWSAYLLTAGAGLGVVALIIFLKMHPGAALPPGVCAASGLCVLVGGGLGLSAYLSYRKNSRYEKEHQKEIERGLKEKVARIRHNREQVGKVWDTLNDRLYDLDRMAENPAYDP